MGGNRLRETAFGWAWVCWGLHTAPRSPDTAASFPGFLHCRLYALQAAESFSI